MKTYSLLVIILAGFSLAAAGCGSHGGTQSAALHQEHEDHEGETAHSEADGHGHGESAERQIALGENARQAAGLTLADASLQKIENTLAVTGEVAQDTEKTHYLSAQVSGTVTQVLAQYNDIVRSGAVLAVIRTAAGETREITAPQGGLVMGVNAVAGQAVDEISPLFTLSDLGSVYATFDIYEKDAGKIRVGQSIRVTAEAYPERSFQGTIRFVSPRMDETTRTLKVRAEIDNSAYLLKLGMFLNGNIVLSEGRYLAVPRQAVQWLDEKENVFVAKEPAKYEAREIKTGVHSDAWVQVVGGLSAGEQVVVDGGFLLKSELFKSKMGDSCAD